MLTSAAGIVLAFVFAQGPSDCADLAACRSAALEAASRKDYEAFHDLAWRTIQKGKPNDPELLYLIARAQSLSGRQRDALTVLRRLAQLRFPMDAATNEDFASVRALPGWADVDALMKGVEPPPPPPTPAKSADSPAPAATSPPPRKEEPPAKPDPPKGRAADNADEPPALSAALEPIGLAYDAVSRRFIVGDRRTDKLVVIDPVFKRTSDMAGSGAGFFGVTAFAIDRERGDLWVTNSRAGRTTLQKLQLVSGRVLFSATQEESNGAQHFADVAVSAAGHVLVLDSGGRRILRVRAGRQALEPAADIVTAGATSLAALDEQSALVAYDAGLMRVDLEDRSITPIAGAPAGLTCIRLHRGAVIGMQKTGDRMAIIKLTMKGTRSVAAETLVEDADLPSSSSFTVEGDTLHYIARAGGETTIRRLRLR